MAFVAFVGQGPYLPEFPFQQPQPSLSTTLLIDATGEQVAFSGPVWFPNRSGTKDIERVGFRFGNVVKAGGSGLTISLQNVSLTAGPPQQPDGTPDQTVAIANANASFVSNTWIRTDAMSANRTVSFGELLSVVIEFDGGGRLGADSVVISGVALTGVSDASLISLPALYSVGAWASVQAVCNVILEFTDGTFGILDMGLCWSAISTHTYNSGSAADEYALAFQVAQTMKVDGLWAAVAPAASADFDIILYAGTTAMATASIDSNAIYSAGVKAFRVPIAEQTLVTGTTYYVSVKPTTANNVSVYSFDVNSAAMLDACSAGQAFNYSTRVDAGSWAAATTTRRLLAGVRMSAIDDASGSGGGLLVHPGMSGGMRG